jgi:putative transposase
MSERRACRLIKADRKTVRYRSRRPRDDALRGRLRELAAEQRRFGYRRLHILLRAEGHVLNRKKTQRLYREEGLTVRKRKGRKRVHVLRAGSIPWVVEANRLRRVRTFVKASRRVGRALRRLGRHLPGWTPPAPWRFLPELGVVSAESEWRAVLPVAILRDCWRCRDGQGRRRKK